MPTDQEPVLHLVNCKCKAGCSRSCGCYLAEVQPGVLCSPMCAHWMGITGTDLYSTRFGGQWWQRLVLPRRTWAIHLEISNLISRLDLRLSDFLVRSQKAITKLPSLVLSIHAAASSVSSQSEASLHICYQLLLDFCVSKHNFGETGLLCRYIMLSSHKSRKIV